MPRKNHMSFIVLTSLFGLQACSGTSQINNPPEKFTEEGQTIASNTSDDLFSSEYQEMRKRYLVGAEKAQPPILVQSKQPQELPEVLPPPALAIEDRISPPFFFKPGQYAIPDNITRFELENWIKDNLSELRDIIRAHQQEHGVNYAVSATIIGSSNGVATRPGGVPYTGEFGDITIRLEEVSEGGSAIDIKSGSTVTNAELSAIRAYSVVNKFSNHLSNIRVTYDIRTVDKNGGQHRYSQIIFKVYKSSEHLR